MRCVSGGKHGFYEGGVRTQAFVWWSKMPKAAVGTKYDGLAHVCDWRATYAMGVAGVTKAEIASMEQAPFQDESTDHWAAITAGGVAPRTELIHAVHSPKYCKPHDPFHSRFLQMLWLVL